MPSEGCPCNRTGGTNRGRLGTDPQKGLSHGEAKRRLARFGENCLSAQQGSGPVAIFLNQFSDFMVLVLMGAALLSGWLGEWAMQ